MKRFAGGHLANLLVDTPPNKIFISDFGGERIAVKSPFCPWLFLLPWAPSSSHGHGHGDTAATRVQGEWARAWAWLAGDTAATRRLEGRGRGDVSREPGPMQVPATSPAPQFIRCYCSEMSESCLGMAERRKPRRPMAQSSWRRRGRAGDRRGTRAPR